MGESPPMHGDEAFLGDAEHGLFEGEEIDDLTADGPAPESDDDDDADDDDMPHSSEPMLDDDSIQCFEGHQDAVLAVCWNAAVPDMVATGGVDDKAYIWRVGQQAFEETDGTLATFELSGHTDSVVGTAFNAAGTLLATASMDGTVRVWSPSTGELQRVLEGPGGAIEWLRWHPRGDVLIAGSEDFTAWMWNAATGACMQVFSGHTGPVSCGSFSPDGRVVVTGGADSDSSMRVWNPRTGECSVTVQGYGFHEEGISALGIHQDNSAVISGGIDGSVKLTNIQNGRVVGTLTGHEESIEAAGFSPHLPLATTAGVEGKLMIWDVNTLTQRGLCEHPEAVTRLAWHPQQPLVATGCLDGVVRCWDIRTATCVKQLGGHSSGVQDVAFSVDGSFILSGGDDNSARVFQL